TALRNLAAAAGVSLQPIQYGRARRQLGLPALRDSRPDTSRDAARKQVTRSPTATAPDQQPDAVSSHTVSSHTVTSHTLTSNTVPSKEVSSNEVSSAEASPNAISSIEPAPRRKGSPAFDYLVQELRADATLAYATLRNRATAKGYKIAPIMYGRAKALLGLVPVKPRGSKKAAKAAAAAAAAPPLQLKQVDSVAADKFSRQLDDVRNLDQLVSMVRDLDADRRRLRSVLERVVALIDEALD
ncbi:MAG: hypothetical protein ABIP94_20125, partial [Planctomycetota bacterium]